MPSQPVLWIVGAGGLLGRALKRAAAPDFDIFVHQRINWSDEAAFDQLGATAQMFAHHAQERDWVLAWCAGAGVIGTSTETLHRETELLSLLLDKLPDSRCGTIFLSSSAGGTYAGTTELPITEASADAPLSDYGHNKLVQEKLVADWVTDHHGRAAIGRISNLYGPGQSLSKQQGLITQVCLAALTRQPVSIYVSLDTIRDYLFADDCGRLINDVIQRARSLDDGEYKMKICASSRSMSIGGILAETRRVLGRSPAIIMVPTERTRAQGSALSFRSSIWTDLDDRQLTTLPAGIGRTSRAIQMLISESGLAFLTR